MILKSVLRLPAFLTDIVLHGCLRALVLVCVFKEFCCSCVWVAASAYFVIFLCVFVSGARLKIWPLIRYNRIKRINSE